MASASQFAAATCEGGRPRLGQVHQPAVVAPDPNRRAARHRRHGIEDDLHALPLALEAIAQFAGHGHGQEIEHGEGCEQTTQSVRQSGGIFPEFEGLQSRAAAGVRRFQVGAANVHGQHAARHHDPAEKTLPPGRLRLRVTSKRRGTPHWLCVFFPAYLASGGSVVPEIGVMGWSEASGGGAVEPGTTTRGTATRCAPTWSRIRSLTG